MIDTVFFDIGTVLVEVQWQQYLCRMVTDPKERQMIDDVMFQSGLWDEVDRGVWTEQEVLDAFFARVQQYREALTSNINDRLDKSVEEYRIASYDIPGLDKIMTDVKADVKLRSYTLGDNGEERVSESGVYMLVSMVLGIIIYMFIMM